MDSEEYTIYIKDERGCKVPINLFGINEISTTVSDIETQELMKLFPYIDKERTRYPVKGKIQLLIGFQYAAYHPKCIDNVDHLLLSENRFGYSIAGSHAIFKGYSKNIVKHAIVLHNTVELDAFYSIENLGVSCVPKCGSCKCGKCHPGGKDMSIKEEQEYMLIDSKIKFQEEKGRYIASYPWIRNPSELPNNRCYANAMLISTEKRLCRNKEYAMLYQRQINDLLNRKVARKITEDELKSYNGAKFYIAHHAVMKPESKTTPCRLVFDSSRKHNGCSLNDFLAKGPSLLNQLLGILLRFRQGKVGFIGDISKMFHSIDIPLQDQMTHLFLWRNLESYRNPDVHAITALNMGDRPSAAIAQITLKKTAEKAPKELEGARKVILRNSYMDDIPGSCDSVEEVNQITNDIVKILQEGGFVIKEWSISGHNAKDIEYDDQRTVQKLLNAEIDSIAQKVLGMYWETKDDKLTFVLKLEAAVSKEKISKRYILSKVNSIYDPLGLLSPFTVKAKILLRKIWAFEPKIDWDDELPADIKMQWHHILQEISNICNLTFPRAIKPNDAVSESADLVIFSDGSKQAYGAVAYCRWKTKNGFESRLIAAKNRIAPLKVEDIVRLELSGATLSARMRAYITKETELKFDRIYHLVDSNIVKAMINKGSYGYNTFAGNRIGEIHRNSTPKEWFWIKGKDNIADIITRGCSPDELGEGSIWQNGPEFLKLSEDKWPINADVDIEVLPERKKSEFTGIVIDKNEDSLAKRIDVTRFSKLILLIHTTARILKLYKRFKKDGVKEDAEMKPCDIKEAELFWVKEAQIPMHAEIQQGKYLKLQPRLEDGIFVVGGRAERWMEATWNKQAFILLPKQHRFSQLIAKYEHDKSGHLGCAATVSRIRSKYWIVGIMKTVNSIISKCIICKRKFKRFEQQIMSPLPIERIKPSPPFLNIGIDYFGPYVIKGEVQKRTRGKGYGVIFTCLSSRSVYVDIANDYATNGFLQVYRRFITLRGSPQKIFSDKGTCLVGASNELKDVVKGLNWNEIQNYGHKEGTVWVFSPANAPWYNGATEALVKTVKRALNAMVGENTLTFSELQTAFFEAAQLVNQRPIGRHPSNPEEGSYLCPNDLLLGRASTHVPQGPFKERCSNKYRIDFIESVTQCFWKRWIREIFPSLVINPKWHTERRNVQKGDVVLMEDANVIRGIWKMGVVTEAIESLDGKVRRVNISYKNPDEIIVERPIQKLIVIVPSDDSQ